VLRILLSFRSLTVSLSALDGSPLRIDLVFPVLPPTLDGIGDHTSLLAEALAARGCRVRILTAQTQHDPIDGVEVCPVFGLDPPTRISRLYDAVTSDSPDVLLLQFNQFSYGPLGFNPVLPWTLARIRRACPALRVALMAHEEFVPATSLRNAVMSTWQRAQLWALGRLSDVVGVSTSAWVEKFQSWFPNAALTHWPVGSNIPRSSLTRSEARARLQIDAPFAVGYFGSIAGSRHLDHVTQTLARLHAASDGSVELLYVGTHGPALRAAFGNLPMRDAGPLPPEAVADHFAAMDLYLAPFVEGVSTRRGSFMTSLQHGIPTLATSGSQTDAIFHLHDGDALLLRPEADADAFAEAAVELYRDAPRRLSIGGRGHALYATHFDWPVLATTVEADVRDIIHRPLPTVDSSAPAPSHSFLQPQS